MSWLSSQPIDFFVNSFTYSEVPLVVCRDSGKIVWTNKAFEEFIGYNNWELTTGPNGNGLDLSRLSLNDENQEADKAMLKECIAGNIKSYSVKKQYIPKNDKAVWADLHVIRYPLEGDLKYFVTTVIPLKNGTAAAFSLAMNTIKELTDKMNTYSSQVNGMEQNIIAGVEQKIQSKTEIQNIFLNIAKLVEKHPKVSIAIVMTLLTMILGNQLVEAIKNMKTIVGI